MYARIREKDCHRGKRGPFINGVDVNSIEIYEKWQGPELGEQAKDPPLVEKFGHVGDE